MEDKLRPFTARVQEGRHGKYIVTDSGRQVPTNRAGIGQYPVGTELTLKSEGGKRYRVLQERRPYRTDCYDVLQSLATRPETRA